MELVVYKTTGEESGRKVVLNEQIFGIEPNDHAIYLDVKLLQANKRQGTHSAKERNAVSGSTRKLKRQKGTGGARSGDIKSPLLRGGGRVFGPRPRNYSFKLNKKVRKIARLSALTYKAKENGILIVEDFNMATPKTKLFNQILTNLKVNEIRTLLVLPIVDQNMYLSSRNLFRSSIATAKDINTYDLLHANKLIITESGIKEIEKLFNE
jgi:large subunit ribosomal protein L4